MSFSLLWFCKNRVRFKVALQVTGGGVEHQELSFCTDDVVAV